MAGDALPGSRHSASQDPPRHGGRIPRRWVNMYEDFISVNSSSVGQIEGALRSLAYIVPGRLGESEIVCESLHTAVQLLSLYHDSILSKTFSRLPSTVSRPLPSFHSRYTKFWSSRSKAYTGISHFLQTVRYIELLCEMIAKRKGERIRWRLVVILETIKAVSRLFLLYLTGSRPLASPTLPEREQDPRNGSREDNTGDEFQNPADPAVPELSTPESDWTMPRTRLTLRRLPDSMEMSEYLFQKVLTADDVKAPWQLLRKFSTSQGYIAEVMWILRPLIYALVLQRWRENKRSWTPWLTGVAIEMMARQLAKRDLRSRLGGSFRGLTGLEKEELRKRGWDVSHWMLRGAFYENLTRTLVLGVTRKFQGKPILDMLTGVIEDYDRLWTDYYFSTATI